jgi:hypothetical protein
LSNVLKKEDYLDRKGQNEEEEDNKYPQNEYLTDR